MNTSEIMELALSLAEEEQVPPDSAIYHAGEGIKKILMGIDMGVAELALARELGYDAVIAHHPQGAMGTFYKMIDEHVNQLQEAGVPGKEAEKAVKALREKYELRSHSINAEHVTSFARLLNMPFLNIHYPLDKIGRQRMMEAIEKHLPEDGTVEDVVRALETLPEFHKARTEIKVRMGEPGKPAGKVVVSHAAGTNGGYSVARSYFEHGTDTLIYIHVDYGDLDRLRQDYSNDKNFIVTGHIVSDLLGINPFIAELEKRGLVVDRVSGLR
ncbi:MAG: hypothetical protein UMV23_01215 [Halanaerobium sp.]|nr:hypothetical protein [Halanaerobium sp.]